MVFDKLSNRVIGSCIEVHKNLGPGLLESAYAACLAIELSNAGIKYQKEKRIDINYKGYPVDSVYRADFVIENELLLELKSIDSLAEIHVAQTLTYLKVSGLITALLINFNVPILKEGIRRFVGKAALQQ